MKTERNGNVLVIKETPGCLWIFGLFFAMIGASFIYGAAGGYTNYDRIDRWIMVVHMGMGILAVASGYWIIFKAPITRIKIDRNSETVTYSKKGLAGMRVDNFRFDQIEGFTLVEDLDDEGSPIFSLGMQLVGGQLLTISAMQSHVEQYKRDLVYQANEFMYKQMPSSQTFELDEDET